MTAGDAAAAKSCCAGFYELPVVSLLLGDSLHPGGPALTRQLAATTVVGRESVVLDVACGRGESARVLAAHCGCRVVGIDYSRANVAQAEHLTRVAGLRDRVQFVVGDAEALPFADASFDVVFSECSMCTFPDMHSALVEAKRVLRAGGRIGLSDVVLNAPVPELLESAVGHVLCITGALSAAGYRSALEQAGFATVRARDVSHVITDMLTRVEKRMVTVGNLLQSNQFEHLGPVEDSQPKFAAAHAFVASGGAGYALFTGRKSRDDDGR